MDQSNPQKRCLPGVFLVLWHAVCLTGYAHWLSGKESTHHGRIHTDGYLLHFIHADSNFSGNYPQAKKYFLKEIFKGLRPVLCSCFRYPGCITLSHMGVFQSLDKKTMQFNHFWHPYFSLCWPLVSLFWRWLMVSLMLTVRLWTDSAHLVKRVTCVLKARVVTAGFESVPSFLPLCTITSDKDKTQLFLCIIFQNCVI